MKRGTRCGVHIHREDVPQQDHHIKPQEYGGMKLWHGLPNLILICSNAHGNVHYFMDLLFKYEGKVPWKMARTFGRKTRNVARMGYERVVADAPTKAHVSAIRDEAVRRLQEAA